MNIAEKLPRHLDVSIIKGQLLIAYDLEKDVVSSMAFGQGVGVNRISFTTTVLSLTDERQDNSDVIFLMGGDKAVDLLGNVDDDGNHQPVRATISLACPTGLDREAVAKLVAADVEKKPRILFDLSKETFISVTLL